MGEFFYKRQSKKFFYYDINPKKTLKISTTYKFIRMGKISIDKNQMTNCEKIWN